MTKAKVRLCVGHQHSQFWPILPRFVNYYSVFWGLGVISTIDEPQGALTCRSSTLAVLADSGPFRGLLLTVLGSPSDFHGHQHSQFWQILARFVDYYSQFWVLEVISTINEHRGALTCRLSTLVVLADSGPFGGLLLTVLGSRSDFHD